MVMAFYVQQRLVDFRSSILCGRLCVNVHWNTIWLELYAEWQRKCLTACMIVSVIFVFTYGRKCLHIKHRREGQKICVCMCACAYMRMVFCVHSEHRQCRISQLHGMQSMTRQRGRQEKIARKRKKKTDSSQKLGRDTKRYVIGAKQCVGVSGKALLDQTLIPPRILQSL